MAAFSQRLSRLLHGHESRWLYTGSIGLDSVARRDSVEGALNDLDVFPFAPFAPDTARAFLADIARRRGCALHEDAAETILRRLGWLSPYYLEKVAEDACILAGAGGALDLPRAQAALDRMLDLEKRTYWSTWREHLDRNFPEPERGRLYTVLEIVAKSDAWVSRDAFLPALKRGGEPVLCTISPAATRAPWCCCISCSNSTRYAFQALAMDNFGETRRILEALIREQKETEWNPASRDLLRLPRLLRLAADRGYGDKLLAWLDEQGYADRYWPLRVAFDAYLHGEARLIDVNPEVRGAAKRLYDWLDSARRAQATMSEESGKSRSRPKPREASAGRVDGAHD